MATPVGDSYSCDPGGGIAAGRHIVPAWAQSLAANTWTELAGTNYQTAASAIIPAGAYIGSNPITAPVDAYADPATDEGNHNAYFWGGGHRNGTMNGIVGVNLETLTYSLKIAPTPPAKYPPIYAAGDGAGGPGALQYPSGATPPYFSSALTDPADAAYLAPQDAPVSTHMYAASAMRGNKIFYFYGQYKEADILTGQWSNILSVDLGAQLYAIDSNFGNGSLGQGTGAVYDPVTDQFIVSLVPGDMGYSWRVGFFRFNPTTRQIVPGSVVTMAGGAVSGMPMFRAGRYCYAFGCNSINDGWRYNFDTGELKRFVVAGDTFTFTGSTNAEAVPANYHAGRNTVIRWRFIDEVAALYEINLTPVSGAGTAGDPYVLTQTRRTISGPPPAIGILNYRRIYYNAKSECLMFLPKANSNWYAVKLS